MSAIKRELERREAVRESGREAAIKAGRVAECEFHPGTYLDVGDETEERQAYAIATNMHKQGMIDGSLKEVRDAVQSAIADSGPCYSCERNFGPD